MRIFDTIFPVPYSLLPTPYSLLPLLQILALITSINLTESQGMS
ncbi:hypothetical protein [Moorena producens]